MDDAHARVKLAGLWLVRRFQWELLGGLWVGAARRMTRVRNLRCRVVGRRVFVGLMREIRMIFLVDDGMRRGGWWVVDVCLPD
jgi:hypothetical protein